MITKVYFKDHSQEPMTLDNEAGSKLKKWFLDKKISDESYIDLKVWAGHKGDIKNIYFTAEEKGANYHEEYFKQMVREGWEMRKMKLARTIEQKANDLEIVKLLVYALKGTFEIPKDIEKQIIDIQRKEFEKEPNKVYINLSLLKEPIDNISKIHEESDMKNLTRRSSMMIVERLIGQDSTAYNNEQAELNSLAALIDF